MVARFLDHNNLSRQRQHLHCRMMQERYGLWWATVLFLSAIRHRKVIHVNFFIFFCHICKTMVYWDPGILLAWQSDINNSSSLHKAKQHRCQPLHEECLFCSTFPYHYQPKPPPLLTTQPNPQSYPCISGVPVHMTTRTLSIEEQQLECNALLELAVGQGAVFIYNMLFFITTYSIQILILESHQNLKCHQWIWHELE